MNSPSELEENIATCKELLACVEPQIILIQKQLAELIEKYREVGEDRIAWEMTNAVRALDQTVNLAQAYLDKTPLPTIDEIQEIYKQSDDTPK